MVLCLNCHFWGAVNFVQVCNCEIWYGNKDVTEWNTAVKACIKEAGNLISKDKIRRLWGQIIILIKRIFELKILRNILFLVLTLIPFSFQISREESDAKQLALEKEMTKVVAACEEKINALKADNNQQIQQRKKLTKYLGVVFKWRHGQLGRRVQGSWYDRK